MNDAAAIDMAIDPDARACFGTGFGATCLPSAPTAAFALPVTNNFDTSTGCTHVVMTGGIETCVLAGTTVALPTGVFRAVGPRPLVIVASQTITINGTISVASIRGMGGGAGASTAVCPTPNQGQDDGGGGGGGAGGTFVGAGAVGGTGDANGADTGAGGQPAGAMQPPT